MRRRSWLADGGLVGKRIVFSAGAGTERAVGIVRNGTSEGVVTTTAFVAADFQADDWEAAQ